MQKVRKYTTQLASLVMLRVLPVHQFWAIKNYGHQESLKEWMFYIKQL
ncbi:UNVERIFIED_CONTAM: hypothetical protein GTU68_016317 [Idotea baltica]|nr:hypothetical protein [Idotea baltica]